ncbi:hypothetical protein Dda_8379 [Drechslerella dactyloides]|uniref:Nephrocystin 3-like N-terminal domain-containing protein n=1 Tax=Drechslerella dactyloides TaxID=74499 RepID=A0AAD6IQJ8_DREDA|nr:hypothetical protein Dda_8379 [Drechslerella dactyloides]
MTIRSGNTTTAVASKPVSIKGNASRKTLAQCFEDACTRFRSEIANPAVRQDSKRSAAVETFLSGAKLDELGKACKELSDKAGDGVNNAEKLWGTLDQFKGAADTFLQFAPESVSIVWFGISSLITIGNAKVQTRLLICGTCDSIANIVGDCVRWEQRMAQASTERDESPKLDIWESDIPTLIFSVLDFLWNARPHLDQSRIKRIGSTLKDIFTKELQQKVDAIVEKYQEIVKVAQAHFEESVFHESLRTGLKLDQIERDLKQYVTIGAELVNAVQQQAIIYELDRQQARLTHSMSYKLHFSSLNDRLNKIARDRNGRLAADWIFKEDAYVDWKSASADTAFLCIRGPRGHGKSVAMMSVHREIQGGTVDDDKTGATSDARPPVVCHFYFKKGEQDIETARSGLESVLYQLLDTSELRQDTDALISVIDILNPAFGDPDGKTSNRERSISFMDSHKTLCDTIRAVSTVIPSRIYVMFDALDECQDRREQEFLRHIHCLVKGTTTDDGANIRVIISCRDNVDIMSEFMVKGISEKEKTHPERVNTIEITLEKNFEDLREFIMHDVGELLIRRIDKKRFASFFRQELSRIVDIIHQKAKGDFTLARMIIANLQQPSKITLDKRIQQLPSAIGDIYMASLESLTPDEQELVVTALKWVVWSVTGINVIEISDHYREAYRENAPPPQGDAEQLTDLWASTSSHLEESHQDPDDFSTNSKLVHSDPYEDPDIKDIIYHIENAGRDFFKFDRNTGVVSVDISIREWIQEDNPGSKAAIKHSRGFNKYRDTKGNTVFKFTLTPSFVRYGDSLSELFSEREAQMSITVDVLRTLNNELFQNKYMTWEPEWIPGKPKQQRRYEIDHWQDHIRIMQKWWNKSCLDDSWWTELLTQLSIFTSPENWYIWNIQREFVNRSPIARLREIAWKKKYMMRLFDEPIHLACKFGLPLMIDMLVRDSECPSSFGAESVHNSHKMKRILSQRAFAFTQKAAVSSKFTDIKQFLPGMDRNEILDPLTRLIDEDNVNDSERHLRKTWDNLLSFDLESWRCKEARICDKLDIEGQTPLYLAAPSPETLGRLMEHGADIEGISLRPIGDGTGNVMQTPLLAILCDLTGAAERGNSDKMVQSLLRSAEMLVSKGASLQVEGLRVSTLLHLAAKIRNLQFFKLLCVSGDWDVHAKDSHGQNPMHYLFLRPRPTDPNKIQEVLGICQIMIKMRHLGDDDLVNSEDLFSKNPLAYAVGGGFREAVELLIKLGADIHDESNVGQNCFHHLAGSNYARNENNPEADLAVADILLKAGVDCAKRDSNGNTPLLYALTHRNWHIAKYLLKEYDKIGKEATGDDNPLLARSSRGQTLIHNMAEQTPHFITEEYLKIFHEIVTLLSGYTDLEEMIHLRDEDENTALHIAAYAHNFEIVKFITNISSGRGISTRNQSLCTAMDVVVKQLARVLSLNRDFPYTDADIELMDMHSKIFYHLFSLVSPSEFSFSFLEASFRGATYEGALGQLGLEKLVKMCESQVSSVDMHGWSLFDVLYAIDRIDLLDPYLPRKELSPAENFAKPSKLGWCSCCLELSSDGLGFYLPVEDSKRKRFSIMADHPVPPFDQWFYFEVHVANPTSEDFERDEVFNCWIGVRGEARQDDFIVDFTQGHISVEGYYWGRAQLSPANNPHQEQVYQPSITTRFSDVGCGINPITREIFFTVDGEIRAKPFRKGIDTADKDWLSGIRPARYFPGFACRSPSGERFKINLGAERFVFEPANDPEWRLDNN